MPRKRAQWSEEQLRQAMDAVRDGMAVRTASATFRIPRRTLRNHLASGQYTKRIGRPCILTHEQENDLQNRILRLAEVGLPITYKCLRRSVYTYVNTMQIVHNFPEKTAMAGRKWIKLFLKRHPIITRRKAQHMNAARAAKLNRYIVTDYFEKLKTVMTEAGVTDKPQSIFNIDEKGCQLNLHKQQTVFAKKGVKRVHMLSEEHAQNVTIVSCGNALGQAIPPMILMKGVRQKAEWSLHLPPGSIIQMTAKGSMTTEMFVKWIKHFSQYKPPGKVLLIFDGASSHLDYTIVEAAEEENIQLFCLPSNTTHELQPMDKAVFKPFESYWDDEVLNFWTNKPNHTINKTTFGLIFAKVWPKAASPTNIIAGFRATGIYPYDPNIIPDEAFAPSELTVRRVVTSKDEENSDNKQEASNSTAMSLQKSTTSQCRPLNTNNTNNSKVVPDYQQAGPSNVGKHQISITSSEDSSDYSVHNTSSSEGEEIFSSENDSEPEPKKGSFKDILPTPDIEEKKITPRKKSLNYRAQKVTKALFVEKDKQKEATRDSQKKVAAKSKKVVEKWYCHLCQKDKVMDMRLCSMCLRYVHEECVGLTKKDREPSFLCPSCS